MRRFKWLGLVAALLLAVLASTSASAGTSTVTYYFNAQSGSDADWTSPANAIDASDLTSTVMQTVAGAKDGWFYLTGNTSSGTSLGRITKVEYRIKSEGGTTNVGDRAYLKVQPEFGGTSLGTLTTIFDILDGNDYAAQYCAYTNITNDVNAPAWSSNWSTVSELDFNFYGYLASSVASVVKAYYIEIRITYQPHGSYQVL